MQTNPESATVEAVAWRYWSATHPWHVNVLGPGQYEYMDAGKWHPDHAEPLYPQSALDALRGEVERLGEQLRYASEASCHETTRADAAERRVTELEALLRAWHAEESRYGVRSQAPGHRHQVPGVWDSDNGPIAGTACAKCALWAQIREIARTESP